VIRKCVCGGGKLLGGSHPALPADSVFFPANADEVAWEISFDTPPVAHGAGAADTVQLFSVAPPAEKSPPETLPCVKKGDGEAYERRMWLDSTFYLNREGAVHSKTKCTTYASSSKEASVSVRCLPPSGEADSRRPRCRAGKDETDA
jgi:hypothetical protein